MNMIAAAEATLELAREREMDMLSSDVPELDFPHLQEMFDKMKSGEMSEGKLGRWLGWMQAAVVAAQIGITLEDMKNINKQFAD